MLDCCRVKERGKVKGNGGEREKEKEALLELVVEMDKLAIKVACL